MFFFRIWQMQLRFHVAKSLRYFWRFKVKPKIFAFLITWNTPWFSFIRLTSWNIDILFPSKVWSTNFPTASILAVSKKRSKVFLLKRLPSYENLLKTYFIVCKISLFCFYYREWNVLNIQTRNCILYPCSIKLSMWKLF